MNEIKHNWKKWLYWFVLGVALICIYKILDNYDSVMGSLNTFFGVISPFLIGIFIAYILYMPSRRFEELYRKIKIKFISKRARGLGVITVYIIIIVAISILCAVILPIVFESITDFISSIPHYIEDAINAYNHLPQDSIFKSQIVQDEIHNLQNIDIKQYLDVETILGYLVNAIGAIFSIVDIFIAIIVSVYILLTIMGVRYAPLLGFFIGLFNMIPYVGAIIATVISAIITFITGGLSQTIWMLIVVIILQQIDANIINPRIVGKSLKISPLLVLFAVTFGGAYFGILGMFLAVPVIAVIKILLDDFINYRETKKKKMKVLEEK